MKRRTAVDPDAAFAVLRPVVEMLGKALGRNTEIVLHDLRRPERSIIAIANGHVSDRSLGGPIIGGPRDDKGLAEAQEALRTRRREPHSIVANYTTRTRAGRELRSSTLLLRDDAGVPFGGLCVNCDLNALRDAHSLLTILLSSPSTSVGGARQTSPSVEALMKEIIEDAVDKVGMPLSAMAKKDKMRALEIMVERGLFMVKGGAEHAARALRVSRYTVYNYLDALRGAGAGEGSGASEPAIPMRRRRTGNRTRPARSET
ncbi:MAG: transcriptional regulator [Hyphomicrobiales bacterium]